jgi:hypothetical protein
MSQTIAPEQSAAKTDVTFALDVSEQELLDEFGVLYQAEYTYGA